MNILVVDDDPDARILMRAALRKAGFEVALAGGGHDALEQFGATRFDMVMLDVDMPGMNGHEVAVILRARAGDLLPIVMVTGMDDVGSVERAYQSGATDFIAKPINWSLLGHRVRYLLRGYQVLLELVRANARNAAVLEAIPDLLFELDGEGRYIDYRAPRGDYPSTQASDFLGMSIRDVLPAAAAEVCMSALREAREHGSSRGLHYEIEWPQGSRSYEISVSRKDAEGDSPHFIILSRDVTERKVAEGRIERLAYFDSLTGLSNRQSFLDRIGREIKRRQHDGSKFGILFLDLDSFKNINDTLGHSAGDRILQAAADRLQDSVRPSDLVARDPAMIADSPLARLGGDEFTALILDVTRPSDVLVVANRILDSMRRPFLIDGREIIVTSSIGIAQYPEDGGDAATLLKHADTAMYHAKESGRDNCKFYNASQTEKVVRRVAMEDRLRTALERQELSLEYQPQIDVVSGRIHSMEALVRWTHPELGPVPPLDFIPLAEENGTILAIGEWVLRTACAEAAQWPADAHPMRVAVNLSPLQFKDPNLVQMVLTAVSETGLRPEQLELEITEGAVMDDTASTLAKLRAFRNHGIRVALDDFGTGFSSLSYLTRMPLSNLKIDRSFVAGLPLDIENLAIVRAILAMSHSLSISVTAEGVETLEQAQVLKALGCDMLQGYFFSRPVPPVRIAGLLSRQWTL